MMGGVLINTFYTIFQTAKITNKGPSHLYERPTKILYCTVNKNSFFVDFVKMVGKLKYIRIFMKRMLHPRQEILSLVTFILQSTRLFWRDSAPCIKLLENCFESTLIFLVKIQKDKSIEGLQRSCFNHFTTCSISGILVIMK